jgi:hypothetical protein
MAGQHTGAFLRYVSMYLGRPVAVGKGECGACYAGGVWAEGLCSLHAPQKRFNGQEESSERTFQPTGLIRRSVFGEACTNVLKSARASHASSTREGPPVSRPAPEKRATRPVPAHHMQPAISAGDANATAVMGRLGQNQASGCLRFNRRPMLPNQRRG